MTTKEKFETGNYILLRRYLISDGYYIENNPKDFDIVCPDILINKKHKHILDAYLKNNDVEIEYRNPNDFKHIWECDDFIGNYNESYTYKLKEALQEYITVPNSDKKFLKPEFECVIYEEIKHKVSGIVFYIGRVYKEKEGYYPCSFEEDGSCFIEPCGNAKEFNLAPYEEPKPWYEIESNFPCVFKSVDTGMIFGINNQSEYINLLYMDISVERLTNEEIDSLKIKD